MYHFISGYTAKVAGTEMGVDEPQATFSACFGAAFLVWHPTKYAEMLAERLAAHRAQAWLVNTGWTGGAYGTGRRIELALHAGHHRRDPQRLIWPACPRTKDPMFGLAVPERVPSVPSEILHPEQTWADPAAYRKTAERLAGAVPPELSAICAAAAGAGSRVGRPAHGGRLGPVSPDRYVAARKNNRRTAPWWARPPDICNRSAGNSPNLTPPRRRSRRCECGSRPTGR